MYYIKLSNKFDVGWEVCFVWMFCCYQEKYIRAYHWFMYKCWLKLRGTFIVCVPKGWNIPQHKEDDNILFLQGTHNQCSRKTSFVIILKFQEFLRQIFTVLFNNVHVILYHLKKKQSSNNYMQVQLMIHLLLIFEQFHST